nr:MAG TPA: hypothetical protein [Caudoviricetes sp.]
MFLVLQSLTSRGHSFADLLSDKINRFQMRCLCWGSLALPKPKPPAVYLF